MKGGGADEEIHKKADFQPDNHNDYTVYDISDDSKITALDQKKRLFL